MAVACAGLQSVFTAAYDEAFAIPTELSARTALRVQQIVAYETDVAKTIDPLAGSYFVEALTDDMEQAITTLMDDIEQKGGMVRCLEEGYHPAAHRRARLRVSARSRLRAGPGGRRQSVPGAEAARSRCRSTAPTKPPSAPRPRRWQTLRATRDNAVDRRARSTRWRPPRAAATT